MSESPYVGGSTHTGTGQPLAQRGPGEIQAFLQDARDQLGELDGHLQEAHDALEEALLRWQEHYDSVLETLEEDVREGRLARLPGEDSRLSLARRTGDGREVWNTYRRADRAVRKWEQRSTLLRGQIGAAQSEAKLMGVV